MRERWVPARSLPREPRPDVAVLFETTVGAAPDDFAFSGPLTMVLERGPERGRIVTGHTSTPSPPGAGRPPGPDREQP